ILEVAEAKVVLSTPSLADTADADSDGKLDPVGLELGTPSNPLYIDFDGNQRIGFSSELLTLQLSQFVHLTGGFAFEMGPVLPVNVATGLPSAGLDALETLGNSIISGLGTTLKNKGTLIENVEVATFQIGASNVHAFIGLNGPYWKEDLNSDRTISWSFNTGSGDDDSRTIDSLESSPITIDSTQYTVSGILPADTVVTLLASDGWIEVDGVKYGDIDDDQNVDADETDELSDNAVGLALSNLNFGLVTMEPTIGSFATLLGITENQLKGIIPKFTAMKATSSSVELVGVDELVVEARDIAVNLNNGDEWFGLLGPPVVDFAGTPGFADERLALFDTNSNGSVTVGELRTLAGLASG
ncbi:hypothetical protein LCGC14_3039280, partial [marine sediment metagenome]